MPSETESPPCGQTTRQWLNLHDPARATLTLILITAAIRVGLGMLMDFGNGEAYYLASTRDPNLSYFDQPPLFLWLGWAVLTLTGSDAAALIRLPFIALFAGTTWMLFVLTRRLISPWAGFYAALFLNVSAVFTISVGGWFQPDGPLMLFWLLTAWALARVMLAEDRQPSGAAAWGWWLLIGLLLGLTLLSKYHAVFLVAGAGLFALTRRDQWHWIIHPAPYVAMVLALIVALPVLIWNAQNDWVSFAFQGGRSIESMGIRPEWLLRSLIGQMTWLLPWVWLPMIAVFALALARGPKAPKSWFLACLAVGPIAFFTIVALWAPLGFHFHWQAPGYLMLFPLLGGLAAAGMARRPRLTKAWVGGSVVFTSAVILVLGSHIATNWIDKVYPLDKDPTLEGLDWSQLSDPLAERGLLSRERTFAAAVQWVEGGKVDTAVGGAMPVVVLSNDPRNLAFTFDLRRAEGWDVLLMGTERRLKDPAQRFDQFIRGPIELVGRFDLHRGGDVVIEDIGVFLGRDVTTRHRLAFDGSDPDSYFGDGWGPFGGGPGSRAIVGPEADLRIMIEPRVPYGRLVVSARGETGQQALGVRWQGREVGRLVLPADGSPATLDIDLDADRQVGRYEAVVTLVPERPGVTVEAVDLLPIPLDDPD
jgi:hypothetical protein